MSNTPTSAYSEFDSPFTTSGERQFLKQRRLSAPSSPQPQLTSGKLRARERDASPPPTPGPSQVRTPRKRASVAVTHDVYGKRDAAEDKGEDVMAAALAAVASSRNAESIGASGNRGKRNASRHPLPLEFHGRERQEGSEVSVCRRAIFRKMTLTVWSVCTFDTTSRSRFRAFETISVPFHKNRGLKSLFS